MVVTISAVGQAILNAVNQYKKTNVAVIRPSRAASNARARTVATLPASFIKTQQALSEKFGIPTFDLTGKISTIPRTVPLNTMINVGVGSSGLSQNVFNDLLSRFTPSKPTVPVQDVFSPGVGFVTTQPTSSNLTAGEIIVPSAPGLLDSLKGGLSDIQRSIGPTGIAIGLLLLGVVLLKR